MKKISDRRREAEKKERKAVRKKTIMEAEQEREERGSRNFTLQKCL